MTSNVAKFLAILFLLKGVVSAEQPTRTAEQLREDATDIVVGKIQQVYRVRSIDGNWATKNSVAEIRIDTVEKAGKTKNGSGVTEGGLLYARFWNRAWMNKQQPPPLSASGHYAVEATVGTTVRAFLRRNENDHGFDVLLTNGMLVVEQSADRETSD